LYLLSGESPAKPDRFGCVFRITVGADTIRESLRDRASPYGDFELLSDSPLFQDPSEVYQK
jgi:hypothetical protein